jgi:hypothetical protein
VLVAVYGEAKHTFKEHFLTELLQACNKEHHNCYGGRGILILYEAQAKRTTISLRQGGSSYLML